MNPFKQNMVTNSRVLRLNVLCIILTVLMIAGCKKTSNELAPDQTPVTESTGKIKDGKIDMQLIAGNFISPLGVVAPPDGSNRLFVIDQIGKIWIINGAGTVLPAPFMDISSRLVPLSPGYDERGLLGLAFHPDYMSNRKFYLYYQVPPNPGGPQTGVNWNNLSIISEFKASAANMNMADLSTERKLLEIDDPQSNHNGGTLEFGPDGYLYISLGDGGAANDVGPGHAPDWYLPNAGGNGQELEANLFGNILRIDVNSGNPYGIPADNPFVNKPGRDEIYAYGFRNPYRFSFDMSGSRRLYAGDAGQLRKEEIDVVKKGGNYGWNVKEGTECFNAASSLMPFPMCPEIDNLGTPLTDPVLEINNWRNPQGGRATTIIGGNVYRGHSIPGLHGKYVFGTFSQTPTTTDGELFFANPAGPGPWSYQEINLASHPNDIGYYLKGFGQDPSGEIYLTVSSILGPSGNSGKVFKLIATP